MHNTTNTIHAEPFTVDPYGEAMHVITQALTIALDDGVNGAMSEGEFATLEALAMAIADRDPGSAQLIVPRPG